MKSLFIFVQFLLFPFVIFSQNVHYAFHSASEFPKSLESFENTFGYNGKLEDVDAVWCLTHTAMTQEERLDIIVEICTIADTLYTHPIYPVDNLNFFQSFVVEVLKANSSDIILRLNERSVNENINFWTFVFSSIDFELWAPPLKDQLQQILHSHILCSGNDLYKYPEAFNIGYERALLTQQFH